VRYHKPVLLQEVLDYLKPSPGKVYIDATAGGGGHTFEIIGQGAKVLGLDRDPESIEYLDKEVKSSPRFSGEAGQKSKVKISKNLFLVNGNYNKIGEIANSHGFEKVDGILFDLGVSSHQLQIANRGFSFRKSGPLDMRMDPKLNIQASDIINNFERKKLDEIFKKFAQEKFSWSIANAICSARQVRPIETTEELATIVRGVYKKRGLKNKIDPATKVFQGLRIVVNSELVNLEEALPQTTQLIKSGGRLVVISFHSLEDSIVKRFFKQDNSWKIITPKPIRPNLNETEVNPRARSARLRAAIRV